MKPFALHAVVLSFWYSLAVAKQRRNAEVVAAFHKLARMAVADWKYFETPSVTALMVAEAQVAEQFESLRELLGPIHVFQVCQTTNTSSSEPFFLCTSTPCPLEFSSTSSQRHTLVQVLWWNWDCFSSACATSP